MNVPYQGIGKQADGDLSIAAYFAGKPADAENLTAEGEEVVMTSIVRGTYYCIFIKIADLDVFPLPVTAIT